MALRSGMRLGPYEILSRAGAGGMGEVYRARDTRLERDVAVKVLPPGLLGDEPAHRRFRKEAQALAQLNHPHIAAIYEFDSQDGLDFLVLEFVEGATLAAKLNAGALGEKEVLRLGEEICSALEEAHDHHIVHRDLKPPNIMLTAKGQVKVLDFGLAGRLPGRVGGELSETLSQSSNAVGTLPYMSPEQLRGEEADARTDIYALGAVLYEMSTGSRPYLADSAPLLINAILHQTPVDPKSLNPRVSAGLNQIISKCLDKDPASRYQSAKELSVDLRRLRAPSSSAAPAAPAAVPRRGALPLYLGLGALALVVVFFAWRYWPRAASTGAPPPLRLEQITAFTDSAIYPALSPDGKMLAFIRGPNTFLGTGQIYLKLLPGGDPVELTHDDLWKMGPVFSPDGSRIAYSVLTEHSWDTWTVPVLVGEARPWLVNASGLTWTSPQRLLFSEVKSGLHMAVVSADLNRTESKDIYVPEDTRGMAHRSYLSPDGKWILLVEMDRGGWLPCRRVPADGSSMGGVVGPATGQCTYAAWSPDSRWMYFTSNAGGSFQLWRQRTDSGKPEQLTFGPTVAEGLAVSPDGKSLITSIGLEQHSIWLHEGDRDRQISGEGDAILPLWGDGFPTSVVSPDGKKIYYLVRTGVERGFGGGKLWVADVPAASNDPFLPGFDVTSYDVSADGSRIVFAAVDSGSKSHIWLTPTDRRASPRQLLADEAHGPVFGPGDLVYFRRPEGKSYFIYEINTATGQQRKVVADPSIDPPMISPDGQWIISFTPSSHEPDTVINRAYSTSGASSFTLCVACFVSWSRDRKHIFIGSIGGGMGAGRTYIVPLAPGKLFPPIPPGGFQSELDVQKLSGARLVNISYVYPGPTVSTYAYARQTVQRNLYRVYLPQ